MTTSNFLKDQDKPEIFIFGVEPERIDYGLDLTPAVAAALPELTAAARNRGRRWREKYGHYGSVPIFLSVT